MTQPTAYNPATSFEDDSVANLSGRTTVDVAALDAEFTAIEQTLDELLANLALVQRDDTLLKDDTVRIHTLYSDVIALFATTGVTVRGAWVTATVYALKDIVTTAGSTYICAVAHTSGTFATDLTAVKWVLVAQAPAAFAASSVTFTPAGGVAASNVQSAIEEVDSEAPKKANNLSDLANAATALTNLGALPTAGGTMTGNLTLSGDPSSALHPATKQYTDNIIDGLGVGQCRLEYVGVTSVRLEPHNGNRLFINGAWYTIPDAGVTLSNTGLIANTTYNVYALISAGSITLEAATTARARDTTYGHQIKSGSAARTLVGKVRTNASSQFSNTSSARHVISWFNRKARATQVDVPADSTTSTSYIEWDTSARITFIAWGDEDLYFHINGMVSSASAGANLYLAIGLDSTSTAADGGTAFSYVDAPASSFRVNLVVNAYLACSEGYHTAHLLGKVGAGTGLLDSSTDFRGMVMV